MKKWTGAKGHILVMLLLSFVITGIYFIFIYQKIPFIYDINDDVAMRNVAAGVITGAPDAHLLHVKYCLGLVIAGLYCIAPGLDWYGLIMIGIILFAFSMILYRGLEAERSVIWKVIYLLLALLLLTCLGLQHITAFQWTTTAAIAGAAGIYLFYTSDTREPFRVYLEEGTAVCLLLLSLMVRDDVFLMVLPVAALCFWWKYGSLKKCGRLPFTLEHLWVPVTLFMGVLLILGIEAFAYRSPQWREFRSYNTNREAIMDYYDPPTYEEEPEFYDSLGFSPEEAENLQRYSLYLMDDLYSENMKKLADYSEKLYIEKHPFKERLSSGLRGIYEHLGKDTYHLTNLICFCMIALAAGLALGRDRKQLELILSVLAVWAAFWLYLGYRNRILERVGFSLYLLAFLTMLGIWYRMESGGPRSRKEKKDIWVNSLAAGGLCAVLLLLASMTWSTVKGNNIWRRDYNLQFLDVNRYMAEHPGNVYFMTTFSIETYTDNFTMRREFAFSNLLSVGGWHTFSPLENEKAKRLGITDAKRDMVEKDNVYVISLENVNLRYMDRYYESLYGEDYHGRQLVDTLDYGEQIFEVYDMTVKEGAG